MKTFNAEVQAEFDTYYIDYKPNMQPNNRFAVWSNRRVAVYVESAKDAFDQIEYYIDQDLDNAIEQQNLLNELEHNK